MFVSLLPFKRKHHTMIQNWKKIKEKIEVLSVFLIRQTKDLDLESQVQKVRYN